MARANGTEQDSSPVTERSECQEGRESETSTISSASPSLVAVTDDREIKPLSGDEYGCDNGTDMDNRPVLSATKQRKLQEKQKLDKLLNEAMASQDVMLDLSGKKLRKIPDELLQLSALEYLYIGDNEIACLPENFFDCLPNLKWLDLRNNYLQSLPNAYIGRHKHLRNLLLEGNELSCLPLELGLVSTLNGLNICNNPMEFPPPEVVEKGTQMVLLFLREVLKAKSLGKVPPVPVLDELTLDDSAAESSGSEDWGSSRRQVIQPRKKSSPPSPAAPSAPASAPALQDGRPVRRDGSPQQPPHPPAGPYREEYSASGSDLVGPVPQSASLQRRVSYNEVRQVQQDKLKLARAHGQSSGSTRTNGSGKGKRSLDPLTRFPEPPPAGRVERRFQEERRLAKVRDTKDRQEEILQKRRDLETLKVWRDESKRKQHSKYREKITKGKIDFVEPAAQAPFAVTQEDMRVPTNQERIAQEVKAKHEKLRAMSPTTRLQLDEARMIRDRELEKKIREHVTEMKERRRQPRGDPREEVEAARRDLQMVTQLQKEIASRRKNLEYRFTAFTGDPS